MICLTASCTNTKPSSSTTPPTEDPAPCSPVTRFADADADGFGDPASAPNACDVPQNYVAQGEDCNDGDPSVYPGAAERCDGVDNDCDGAADPNVVPTEYASVQDAVDDVADGSLVCLLPGTYEETVDVSGRSLSIEGIGGSGAVIFDVSGVLGLDRPIFRANEARLTLRGIGVSGGAQLVGSAAEVPLIIDA